jgi:catechol 2,3-dioxygenase-like lactoylglutathione lyase family enzyme
MTVRANHHVGLRVGDIDRATRFYVEAFGARPKTLPYTIEPDFAEIVMDGPHGVTFQVCTLVFDDGGAIELFEFTSPVVPTESIHATRGNIIHFGLQVDDVPDALARVEAAGGKRLWADINNWGTAKVIYVTDPDNNVIELADASIDEIAELTYKSFPHAKPKEHVA